MDDAGAKSDKAGTVLVVDDTPVMRKACNRAIERAGYNVITAKDGDEALEIALSEKIDVALLDIKMPGADGLEVLKTLKAEKPAVEVIMMTAHATDDAAREAAESGAIAFLAKPFADVGELVDAVNEAARRKRLNDSADSAIPSEIEAMLIEEGENGSDAKVGDEAGAIHQLPLRKAHVMKKLVARDNLSLTFDRVESGWKFRIEGVIEDKGKARQGG